MYQSCRLLLTTVEHLRYLESHQQLPQFLGELSPSRSHLTSYSIIQQLLDPPAKAKGSPEIGNLDLERGERARLQFKVVEAVLPSIENGWVKVANLVTGQ